MSGSLFDLSGNRKYVVPRERVAFASAAVAEGGTVGAFCLALAFTGARISEVLALSAERIDASNEAIVFETLKQRKRGVFRAVPPLVSAKPSLRGCHPSRAEGFASLAAASPSAGGREIPLRRSPFRLLPRQGYYLVAGASHGATGARLW